MSISPKPFGAGSGFASVAPSTPAGSAAPTPVLGFAQPAAVPTPTGFRAISGPEQLNSITSADAAPTLGFGQQSSTLPAVSGFAFGQQSSTQPAASGLAFGQQSSTQPAASGFTFGQQPTAQQAPAASSAFDRISSNSTAGPSSAGFTFGQQPTAGMSQTADQSGSTPQPPSSTFSLGADQQASSAFGTQAANAFGQQSQIAFLPPGNAFNSGASQQPFQSPGSIPSFTSGQQPANAFGQPSGSAFSPPSSMPGFGTGQPLGTANSQAGTIGSSSMFGQTSGSSDAAAPAFATGVFGDPAGRQSPFAFGAVSAAAQGTSEPTFGETTQVCLCSVTCSAATHNACALQSGPVCNLHVPSMMLKMDYVLVHILYRRCLLV